MEPSSTGRRRLLPSEALPRSCRTGGKRRPSRDDGDGEFVRFFASVRKADRDCNIEPPASPYAIMRRVYLYRGENSGPGKGRSLEGLTSRPGIREQYLPKAEVRWTGRLRQSALRQSGEAHTLLKSFFDPIRDRIPFANPRSVAAPPTSWRRERLRGRYVHATAEAGRPYRILRPRLRQVEPLPDQRRLDLFSATDQAFVQPV